MAKIEYWVDGNVIKDKEKGRAIVLFINNDDLDWREQLQLFMGAVNAQPAVVAFLEDIIGGSYINIERPDLCQRCGRKGNPVKHGDNCIADKAESLLRQIGGK